MLVSTFEQVLLLIYGAAFGLRLFFVPNIFFRLNN